VTTHDRTTLRMPRAAEIVAADLRRQVVASILMDGDSLPREDALMARYGVGRPTLREALRALQSQSLISIRQGSRSGPLVHTPAVKGRRAPRRHPPPGRRHRARRRLRRSHRARGWRRRAASPGSAGQAASASSSMRAEPCPVSG
jgi:DNA-binding FadR family transcriptional regulator